MALKTKTTNRPIANRAFTLVEVLMVLAIVAVLSAIVTAATVKGIAMAKSTTCASNLRQIGLAAQMYSTANDGYWPPTAMISFGDAAQEAILFKAEVAPYGAENKIFFCPLDPYAGDSSNDQLLGPEAQTSYGEMYLFLAAGKQLSPAPVISFLVQDTQVVDPSTCGTLKDRGFPSDFSHPFGNHSYLTGHGEFGNMAFADGHVKLYPTTEAYFAQTTSGCLPRGR